MPGVAEALSKDSTFALRGVSLKLANTFSTRRHEIEKALNDKGLCNSRAAEFAALDTCGVKGHISREERFEKARAVGKERGSGPEHHLHTCCPCVEGGERKARDLHDCSGRQDWFASGDYQLLGARTSRPDSGHVASSDLCPERRARSGDSRSDGMRKAESHRVI